MRFPAQATSVRVSGAGPSEAIVIEFGTASEALFSTALPLEFGDRVRLQNSDGSFDATASVVAVRFHQGRRAVAVRFAENIPNWIIR